jgi:DNA recombination protein Rad52
MFTPEQVALLDAPLSTANVKKNPRGYDYVEGWHAIAEANRIFGHGGWNRETVQLTETNRDLVELRGKDGPYSQWRVGYIAKVRVTVGDVTREGMGYGSGMGKPEALGDAVESAVKEAETDAMKRALMTFGNPFGLALYDKDKTNVVEPPSAYDFAVQGLRAYENDQSGFRKVWTENKDNWKAVLSQADYKRLVMVMQDIAAKWAKDTPANQDTPAEQVFA